MPRSTRKIVCFVAFAFVVVAFFSQPPVVAAEKSNATQLIALAKTPGSGLLGAITTTFDAKELKEGTAWAGILFPKQASRG